VIIGTWYECRTSEQQLVNIQKNNRMLLDLGALEIYVRALERARNSLREVKEAPTTSNMVVGAEKICMEIEQYLTLIYMLIESLRDQGTLIYDALGRCLFRYFFIYQCIHYGVD
jgi:hypothetical protein